MTSEIKFVLGVAHRNAATAVILGFNCRSTGTSRTSPVGGGKAQLQERKRDNAFGPRLRVLKLRKFRDWNAKRKRGKIMSFCFAPSLTLRVTSFCHICEFCDVRVRNAQLQNLRVGLQSVHPAIDCLRITASAMSIRSACGRLRQPPTTRPPFRPGIRRPGLRRPIPRARRHRC